MDSVHVNDTVEDSQIPAALETASPIGVNQTPATGPGAVPQPTSAIPTLKRPKSNWTLLACLRITLFLLSAFLLFTHAAFLLALAAPLALLAPPAFRGCQRLVVRGVASWVVCVQWALCGRQRIVLSGDWGRLREASVQRALLFGNHQTYLDWYYLGILAWYTNNTSGLSFILLEQFRHIPFAGWTAYLVGLIFVKQDWDVDEKRLERALRPVSTRPKDPFWLIIFPEGGFPHPINYEKARTYISRLVASPDRPAYIPALPVHVILPRTRGLHTCIHHLQGGAHPITTLVDFTIAFRPSPRFCETGVYPGDAFSPFRVFGFGGIGGEGVLSTVCIDVRVLPAEVAQAVRGLSEGQFDVWLKRLWARKDTMMGHFERMESFEGFSCERYGTEGLGLEEGEDGSGFVVAKEETVEFKVVPNLLDIFNVLFGTVTVWSTVALSVGLLFHFKS
ncbi:hypothetical protein BC830DRAFT_1172456 [Chytriomyces sp. MP71]|nr:hypothetical protein BC830DRAFT_1172456 [Chytriomyces sp. MP71]